MSMCVCESCDRYIDSDFDPDCFVEVGNMRRMHKTTVLCEPCRERREMNDQERADFEEGRTP